MAIRVRRLFRKGPCQFAHVHGRIFLPAVEWRTLLE